MKQKVFIDVKLYDDNMQTIYKKHNIGAEKAIREISNIMNRKIKGV